MITFKLFSAHPRRGGAIVADWTYRHRDLQITTTKHGFGTADALIRMPTRIAKFWFQRLGAFHVDISEQGRTIWEGRIEQPQTSLAEGGLRLNAIGYWIAFSDIRPMQVWSTANASEWENVTTDMLATRNDDLFEMDTEERIFIGLQKGTVYRSGGANDVGSLTYAIPAGSTRNLAAFTAAYGVLLPNNWVCTIFGANQDFSGATLIQTITGNGALQTGSINITSLNHQRIIISVYNNTGGNVTYGGENGSNYAKFTDIRLKTTTSTALYADEILKALQTQVNATNPGQLNPSTQRIATPNFDIRNWAFDELGDAAVDRLLTLGDQAGYLWACRIWENQVIWFNRRANMGRQWLTFGQVEVGRDFSTLTNRVYPRYENAEGNTILGAANANMASIAKAGIIRENVYDAPTTVAADAAALAATYLNDSSLTNAFGEMPIKRIYSPQWSPARLTDVRAGDTITVIDNSVSSSTDVDKLTTFRIDETRYNVATRELTIIPENALPRIDSAIARRDVSLAK